MPEQVRGLNHEQARWTSRTVEDSPTIALPATSHNTLTLAE
jgi:hypothetical protein